MIQMPLPVAAAAPAGIAPVPGQAGEPGQEGEPGKAGDFAAILALGLIADPVQAGAMPQIMPGEPAFSDKPASSKAGGKTLPLDPSTELPPQLDMARTETPEPVAVAPILLALALPVPIPVAVTGKAPEAQPAAPGSQMVMPPSPLPVTAPPAATLPAGAPDGEPAPQPAETIPLAAAPRLALAIQAGGRQFALPVPAKTNEAPPASPAPALAPEPDSPVATLATARNPVAVELAARPAAEARPGPAAPAQPGTAISAELPAPALAASAPLPMSASPAVSAPAVPAPTQPHDFAALVDRLVEARSLAQAGQTVQVVQTAIAHAEFGAVSLRFDTGGNGLSVALSSPDPEFNRAVLAAAPAASADTGSQSGRQDKMKAKF